MVDLNAVAARLQLTEPEKQRPCLEEAWEQLAIARGMEWACKYARAFGMMLDAGAYLSAALLMVPEGAFWRIGHDDDGADPTRFQAVIGVDKEGPCWVTFRKAVAETAAIAVCVASLRAEAKHQERAAAHG